MRPGLCIPGAILFLIACSADGHTAPEVLLRLQTGSSFYIPAMGLSPAEVYWNQTSPSSCTGQSIISVMQGVARPFTYQLLGRVDERLSNGSIVIRSLRPEDGGFYVVCAETSSTPVRTILLTVAGSPSLRYFVWSLSEEVPGIPRFSIVGFLDDIPILSYSSDSQKLEPRGPLVEKTMDPQEWERETDFAKEAERVMRAELLTVGNRRNHTEGLHTVQALIGCTLHTDLSMEGFLQVAYDGEDQFSFKKSKGELHMDGSSQYQWNSQHSAFSQDQADDREKECIKRLRKLLTNGEETLLMRDGARIGTLKIDASSLKVDEAIGPGSDGVKGSPFLNEERHLSSATRPDPWTVREALPVRYEGPGNSIRPGDWILVKSFERSSCLAPRWRGPFQVLLVTQTVVQVAGRKNWIHATHTKKIPHPVPYDTEEAEPLISTATNDPEAAISIKSASETLPDAVRSGETAISSPHSPTILFPETIPNCASDLAFAHSPLPVGSDDTLFTDQSLPGIARYDLRPRK